MAHWERLSWSLVPHGSPSPAVDFEEAAVSKRRTLGLLVAGIALTEKRFGCKKYRTPSVGVLGNVPETRR